jgi:hypothetical protein
MLARVPIRETWAPPPLLVWKVTQLGATEEAIRSLQLKLSMTLQFLSDYYSFYFIYLTSVE